MIVMPNDQHPNIFNDHQDAAPPHCAALVLRCLNNVALDSLIRRRRSMEWYRNRRIECVLSFLPKLAYG